MLVDYEKAKIKAEKIKAEEQAKTLLTKILSESMLRDSSLPEEMKMQVRIMDAYAELCDDLKWKIDKYVSPFSKDKPDLKTLENIYEYIRLVKAGIHTFFEALNKEDK